MPTSFLHNNGGYRKLRAYQVSEIVYDITYHFAHRFLEKGDRTIDQMIQAASSGKQNIAEGSAAATTSREMEIKLYNVARASLQELLVDYEDYLRVRGLSHWNINDEKSRQTRRVCGRHNDSEFYREAIKLRSDETIANIAITLIHQADVLMRGLIERAQIDFLKEGGIREQMTRTRLEYRKRNQGG